MMNHLKTRGAIWAGLGALAVVTAGSLVLVGQTPSQSRPEAAAPRGPRPIPQFQPLLDPQGRVREEAFVPGQALSAADRVYADIEARRMKGLVNEVVAISRRSRDAGDKYWGRIAGTKYEAMTGDWVEGKFKSAGLQEIHRKEFDLAPQWFPIDWSVTAAGGGKTLAFRSLNPATGSPSISGELEADAIWVGLGTAPDFAGRDVRGKAVVIHTMLAPGQMGQSAAFEGAIRRANDAGAAAVVVIWGYYENYAVWQSLGAGVTIPGFFVGFEEGRALRELLASGPTKLKMRLQTERRPNLKTQSIYGTLPGSTDESIIVLAHMDAYYDGALDNASGLSVMVALAEHFAKVPRAQRRRSMVFVGTAGHHVGSPNSPYLRDERADLIAKTAVIINCEHVSAAQTLNWSTRLRESTGVEPRRWWVHGSRKLFDVVLGAYHTFGVSVVGDMDPSATGEMGQIDMIAPSMQLIRSPEHKHTDHDIPEFVPAVGLEAVGRAFAKIVDEVNKIDLKDLRATPSAAPTQALSR